jgi:hypothetical protein
MHMHAMHLIWVWYLILTWNKDVEEGVEIGIFHGLAGIIPGLLLRRVSKDNGGRKGVGRLVKKIRHVPIAQRVHGRSLEMKIITITNYSIIGSSIACDTKLFF